MNKRINGPPTNGNDLANTHSTHFGTGAPATSTA
jgi:hypothetical protein